MCPTLLYNFTPILLYYLFSSLVRDILLPEGEGKVVLLPHHLPQPVHGQIQLPVPVILLTEKREL